MIICLSKHNQIINRVKNNQCILCGEIGINSWSLKCPYHGNVFKELISIIKTDKVMLCKECNYKDPRSLKIYKTRENGHLIDADFFLLELQEKLKVLT